MDKLAYWQRDSAKGVGEAFDDLFNDEICSRQMAHAIYNLIRAVMDEHEAEFHRPPDSAEPTPDQK